MEKQLLFTQTKTFGINYVTKSKSYFPRLRTMIFPKKALNPENKKFYLYKGCFIMDKSEDRKTEIKDILQLRSKNLKREIKTRELVINWFIKNCELSYL